jgi:D-aminoacyl-tRNA deacylase
VRAVVQRVSAAAVTVAGRTCGQIGRGLVVFVGVERGDGPADAQYIGQKIGDLRVFEDPVDPAKHLNRSLREIDGAVLVVSEFTLAADCRKGRRPSFDAAEAPDRAQPLVERVVQTLRESGLQVESGEFRTTMQVSLVNEGPVTLLLDSRKRF